MTNWKEKFDEKFPEGVGESMGDYVLEDGEEVYRDCYIDSTDDIKSFIETLLADSRQETLSEVIKEIEGMRLDPYKMKAKIDRECGNGFNSALHCFPYNTAIDDLLSKLKNL